MSPLEAGLNGLLDFFGPTAIGALFTQFHDEIRQPQFWVAVTQITWINVLLSGDNALVVALACRALRPRQRFWGLILGAGAAVVLRVIFTAIVATVMKLPFLKLTGGLALIVIAIKLLQPDREGDDGVRSASNLWQAVQIIVVADVVMSLDNVIAVAAAAGGSIPLLIFGLASSVPLIVAGAALIMALFDRLPFLIWAGAALLGWIAGGVIATDPAIESRLAELLAGPLGETFARMLVLAGDARQLAEIAFGVVGVVVVLGAGSLWRRRAAQVVHSA
jgi:YjbE family integral membrane protein